MHSAISTAAATVLTGFYGDRNTFTLTTPTAPGRAPTSAKPYTKGYNSFSATATEAGLSRIWGGVHTRLDHQAGNELGTGVGRYVLGELKLTPAKPGSAATKTSAGSGPAERATVAVRDSKLGKILVDGNGRTLYLFEADNGTTSTCHHACAGAWPPLTTKEKPQAGRDTSPALLGTTTRTDHTTEVTYNGHPLYYFVSDIKPGDTTGQGVNSFGAKWYVLNPKGKKIDTR
jgi:predicted lipoprotein with Yx(FWY)xxD motif